MFFVYIPKHRQDGTLYKGWTTDIDRRMKEHEQKSTRTTAVKGGDYQLVWYGAFSTKRDGDPEDGWYPWLKRELESRGLQVEVPRMPEPSEPKIETWVPHLAGLVGTPDAETYFVGHSIGVQTILRYLETIDTVVGGAVAVAGFFTLIPGSIDGPKEEKIAEPWLTRPMDLEKIKKHANKIIAIFSDNDPYVGLENVELFNNRLGAETIILHAKGHIDSHDDADGVPEILEAMMKIAGA